MTRTRSQLQEIAWRAGVVDELRKVRCQAHQVYWIAHEKRGLSSEEIESYQPLPRYEPIVFVLRKTQVLCDTLLMLTCNGMIVAGPVILDGDWDAAMRALEKAEPR